jgi:hypothetical protein
MPAVMTVGLAWLATESVLLLERHWGILATMPGVAATVGETGHHDGDATDQRSKGNGQEDFRTHLHEALSFVDGLCVRTMCRY